MELRQLSYFTTIVNEGNISQAAKKLNISQPPLSHQMKLLESELGVTLFERGSRRIRLTPAGKTFYDRALAILDLSQAARTELTAQKQEIQGVVRLGIISSAVEFVTRHYLAPFRRSYPKALFELHESNSYHLLDLLHSNQIDLAVIRTPFAKAGLEMQTLPPEAFLAIGREMIWSHYQECPNALLTDIPASEPQKSHTPTSLPLSALTRDGILLAVSEYATPRGDERSAVQWVRYRTVGDLTITGAVRSRATGIAGVISEIAAATVSERGETRADDRTSVAAMEDRKREGYF